MRCRGGEVIQLHGADKCAEWDIRDEFEKINGTPVYYGGDLCDSDESDWEDPYDIACAEYVEQYDFDALEGMELMVFERLKGPDESDVAPVESVMVREKTGLTHVRQTFSCYPRREFDTVDAEPVVDIFNVIHDVPDAAVSPNCRSYRETDGGGASNTLVASMSQGGRECCACCIPPVRATQGTIP